jgi:hypothetical protein
MRLQDECTQRRRRPPAELEELIGVLLGWADIQGYSSKAAQVKRAYARQEWT